LLSRGRAWTAAYLGIALSIGWLVEAIGTETGWPFGDYRYTEALGPHLGPVPILIPMAWAMMAYPVLLAAQTLCTKRALVPLVGGFLLAAWDLFLDPQMVGEGYWVWETLGYTLPGIDNIPAQNFAGWLLTAIVLMALLNLLPRTGAPADDRVPTVMLTWVYLSNVLSSAVFFGRPAVAVWGAVCMGVVIVPWWRVLLARRQAWVTA
jgi:putative membrane protein